MAATNGERERRLGAIGGSRCAVQVWDCVGAPEWEAGQPMCHGAQPCRMSVKSWSVGGAAMQSAAGVKTGWCTLEGGRRR